MLQTIDSIILSKTQKFRDRFTEYTGRTKFSLGRWCLIGSLAMIGLAYIESAFSEYVGILIVGTALALLIEIGIVTWEEHLFITQDKLHAPIAHREALTGFLSLVTIGNLFEGYPAAFWCGMCVIAYLYVSACTPKRPGKSKLRMWYGKIKESLRHAIRGTLAPVPAS